MFGTQKTAGQLNKTQQPQKRVQLSIAEVAEITDTSQSTVRRWVAQGKLRAYRYSARVIRIDEEDLLAMREQIAPSTFEHVSGSTNPANHDG